MSTRAKQSTIQERPLVIKNITLQQPIPQTLNCQLTVPTDAYPDQASLLTMDILHHAGSTNCFVHRLHPAVLILRLNASQLGLRFDQYMVLDRDWYYIDRAQLEELCTRVPTPFPRLTDLAGAI